MKIKKVWMFYRRKIYYRKRLSVILRAILKDVEVISIYFLINEYIL